MYEDFELIKTVVISNYFNQVTSFSQFIDIEFQPDLVVIEQVNYNMGASTTLPLMMVLSCNNLIQDGSMLTITSGSGQATGQATGIVYNYQLKTPFPIYKQIAGNYTFSFTPVDGVITLANFVMSFSMTLVFLKLKKKITG